MEKSSAQTRRMVQLAILIALEAVLTFTSLGFIMIPPISITLLHIPVIIGAILMGPSAGGILGLAFGLFSMLKASTAAASPADIAFSPFLSGSPLSSVVMCILPRVLLGVIAGGLYLLLSRKVKGDAVSMGVSAVAATFLHSMMVLGLLSLLFQALPLKDVIAALIGVNCLLEMLAAAVVTAAVCVPLKKALVRR
ncbi:MAG: ECF transporter S component [Clostridiaceae bacterium]|jgi:uncharacterized membrane protein|nr:ECF transporter S component [Clostridiaceae bacterium]